MNLRIWRKMAMNDSRFGHGKIVLRQIISQDETMTIYGKEQEFGEVKEFKEIAETVNNLEEDDYE